MTNHYFATVSVLFHTPQKPDESEDETQMLAGYYRNFGLSAFSEDDARSMVSNEIADGTIDWSDSDIRSIDLATFDQEITSNCKKTSEPTIWYTSGRSIFPVQEA